MKKIIALLTITVLLLVFSVSAFASYSDFVVDEADLLTDSEEMQLSEIIDEINNEHGINVVIHTAADTDGLYVEDYADNFYDNGPYIADGLVFVISMAERDYYTSTCGALVDSLSAYEIDTICQPVVPYLSSGEYYTAFEVYLEQLNNYLSSDWDINGTPYDDEYYAGDSYYDDYQYQDSYYYEDDYFYTSSSGSLFDSVAVREILLIVVAVIIAVVITSVLKSKMNTAVKKHDADDYVVPGSFRLDMSRDAFIGSNVTRRALPQNNNNHGSRPGGGGTGARVSSGGVRHGGSGGKF